MTLPRINNGKPFWTFNIGHLLVIIAMACGFLAWWGSNSPANINRSVEKLASAIQETNSQGTIASRLKDAAQEAEIQEQKRRLDAIQVDETEFRKRIEDKLDEIQRAILKKIGVQPTPGATHSHEPSRAGSALPRARWQASNDPATRDRSNIWEHKYYEHDE